MSCENENIHVVMFMSGFCFRKGFWNRATCNRKIDEVGIQCLGERVTTTTTTPKPKSTTTLPPQICTGGVFNYFICQDLLFLCVKIILKHTVSTLLKELCL